MKQNKLYPAFIQTIIRANVHMKEKFQPKISRSLQATGASMTANVFIGFGKLLMGILSLSFFTSVSAFYTFGMVVAKYFALSGMLKAKNRKEQYHYYFLSGIILIIASIMYIAYSVRQFIHPTTNIYHMYIALAIAAFTFIELSINIRGVIVERHNRTPLIHAIKMINLASSLICLVLTQTAILSFADTQVDFHPKANGFIGILMGCCATLLGVIMILRIRQIQNGKNYSLAFRKIKKLMKEEAISCKLRPVWYSEDEVGEPILHVRFQGDIPKEEFQILQINAKERLHIELLNADRI